MNKSEATVNATLTKRRSLKKRSSSRFDMHFNYFGIDPSGKTIRTIVLDLKERGHEDFIRNCHLQNNYQFSDFRPTKSYKLLRELRNHLLQLSTWLFSESVIPVSLKKELNRSLRFKNPYTGFDPAKFEELSLQGVGHVTLSVLHNNNLAQLFPNQNLQKRLLQEFKRRRIDVSKTDFTEKIEIIKKNKKLLLRNLSGKRVIH